MTNGIKEEIFTRLIQIDNGGSTVSLSVDSIHVRAGKNSIAEQVNLETIKL
jgi:hypothetical protein